MAKPRQGKALSRGLVARWLRDAMVHATPSGPPVSQSELSRVSGVSRDAINSLLGQKRDAQEETLHRLAAALRVPLPDGSQPIVREDAERPAHAMALLDGSESLGETPLRQLMNLGIMLRALAKEQLERADALATRGKLLGELGQTVARLSLQMAAWDEARRPEGRASAVAAATDVPPEIQAQLSLELQERLQAWVRDLLARAVVEARSDSSRAS